MSDLVDRKAGLPVQAVAHLSRVIVSSWCMRPEEAVGDYQVSMQLLDADELLEQPEMTMIRSRTGSQSTMNPKLGVTV